MCNEHIGTLMCITFCFKKLGSAINFSGGGDEFSGAKSSELILNKTNE